MVFQCGSNLVKWCFCVDQSWCGVPVWIKCGKMVFLCGSKEVKWCCYVLGQSKLVKWCFYMDKR